MNTSLVRLKATTGCLVSSLVLAGCTGGLRPERPATALESTPSGYPQGAITLIAPASPGGGWDQTARQIQQVWTEEGIVGVPVEVVNRGGAGGTIGLADFVTRHRDNPRTLMVFGQVMLGATRTNGSPVSVDETVPLARLLNEYEVMRRYGFPIAPTVLAVVLGPLLEQAFRRAMAISDGDLTVFLTRPLSAAILFLAFASTSAPVLARYVAARRHP